MKKSKTRCRKPLAPIEESRDLDNRVPLKDVTIKVNGLKVAEGEVEDTKVYSEEEEEEEEVDSEEERRAAKEKRKQEKAAEREERKQAREEKRKERLAELEAEAMELEEEEEDIDDKKCELEEKLEVLAKEIEGLENENDTLDTKLDEQQEFCTKLADMESNVVDAKKEIKIIKQKRKQTISKASAARETLKALEAGKARTVRLCNRTKMELKKTMKKMQKELEMKRAELAMLQQESIEMLEAPQKELLQKKKLLEQEMAAVEEEKENVPKVDKKVEKAKLKEIKMEMREIEERRATKKEEVMLRKRKLDEEREAMEREAEKEIARMKQELVRLEEAKMKEKQEMEKEMYNSKTTLSQLKESTKKRSLQQAKKKQKLEKMLYLLEGRESESEEDSVVPTGMGSRTPKNTARKLEIYDTPSVANTGIDIFSMKKTTTPRRKERMSVGSSPASKLSFASIDPRDYMRPEVKSKKEDSLNVDLNTVVSSENSNGLDELFKSIPAVTPVRSKRPRRSYKPDVTPRLSNPYGLPTSMKKPNRPKKAVRFDSEVKTTRISLGSDAPSTLEFVFD